MKKPDRAADLLKKGQKAVVLFTRGEMLNKNPTGHSGNWSAVKDFSHVIVYHRVSPNSRDGDIYIGEFTHFGVPIEPEQNRRLRSIHFQNLCFKGRTEGTFWDFTEMQAFGFCYVEGR